MRSTSVDVLIRDAFHPSSVFSSGYSTLDAALPDGGLVVGRVTEISCLNAEVPYRAWLVRLVASFLSVSERTPPTREAGDCDNHRGKVVLLLTRGAREWPLRELFAELQARGVPVGPNTVDVVPVPTITSLSLAIQDLLSHIRSEGYPSAHRLLVVVDHMVDLLLSDGLQYPSGSSLGPSYVVTELGRQLHQLCAARGPLLSTAVEQPGTASSASLPPAPFVSVVVVNAQQSGSFYPRSAPTGAVANGEDPSRSAAAAAQASSLSSSWMPTEHRPYGPQAWRTVADQVLLVGEVQLQPPALSPTQVSNSGRQLVVRSLDSSSSSTIAMELPVA